MPPRHRRDRPGRRRSPRSRSRVTPIAAVLARRAVARRRSPPSPGGSRRLARQLHAALVVDGDDLHLHLVADLHHVVDAADVARIEFGDVAQPVAARGDLDERAEFLDRDDLPLVDRADLDLGAQRLDPPLALPRRPPTSRPAMETVPSSSTSIFAPVSSCKRADVLAAGADQLADHLRVDLHRDHARRERADLLARAREAWRASSSGSAAGRPWPAPAPRGRSAR